MCYMIPNCLLPVRLESRWQHSNNPRDLKLVVKLQKSSRILSSVNMQGISEQLTVMWEIRKDKDDCRPVLGCWVLELQLSNLRSPLTAKSVEFELADMTCISGPPLKRAKIGQKVLARVLLVETARWLLHDRQHS